MPRSSSSRRPRCGDGSSEKRTWQCNRRAKRRRPSDGYNVVYLITANNAEARAKSLVLCLVCLNPGNDTLRHSGVYNTDFPRQKISYTEAKRLIRELYCRQLMINHLLAKANIRTGLQKILCD